MNNRIKAITIVCLSLLSASASLVALATRDPVGLATLVRVVDFTPALVVVLMYR